MKVLIAEDDRAGRFLLRRILQQERGLQLQEAADGVEAWELIRRCPELDLCILDVMMPRMDGLELLACIRSNPATQALKVIICSAVNERFRMAQLSALDICCYIVKPYSTARVLEQVRRVLALGSSPVTSASQTESKSKTVADMEAYARNLHLITQQTTAELNYARLALEASDRRSATAHLRQILLAAEQAGLTDLAQAANQAETAVPLENAAILSALLDKLKDVNQTLLDMASRLGPSPRTPIGMLPE